MKKSCKLNTIFNVGYIRYKIFSTGLVELKRRDHKFDFDILNLSISQFKLVSVKRYKTNLN